MSEDEVDSVLDGGGLDKSKGGGEKFHFSIFSSDNLNNFLRV